MKTVCPEFEPLLLDRAAGVLDGDGERRLEAHLAGCLPCRTEAALLERAMSLAALPPPSAAEAAAVAAGAPGAAARWRAGRRERRVAGRLAVAIAASAAFAIAVPWFLFTRHAPPAPSPASVAVAAPAAADWEPPDLDAVWAAAAAAVPGPADEAAPVMLFAELQEIDLDPT